MICQPPSSPRMVEFSRSSTLRKPSKTAGTLMFDKCFCAFTNLAFSFRTAVALRGKDGVVFAVEKLVTSKLYEVGANRRIFNIDSHIGMVNLLHSQNLCVKKM